MHSYNQSLHLEFTLGSVFVLGFAESFVLILRAGQAWPLNHKLRTMDSRQGGGCRYSAALGDTLSGLSALSPRPLLAFCPSSPS